jgi:virginiamycin B lyase
MLPSSGQTSWGRLICLASTALACAFIVGCSGGASSMPPSAGSNSQQPSNSSDVAVTFTMHWNASTSSTSVASVTPAGGRPLYVPATALSVSVAVNGGTAQYLNSPATTLTINAPVGTDTFVFQTYDETNGQGNVLSQATVTQSIVSGTANHISAVLNGVVAGLTIAVSNPTFPAGTPGSFPITVAAQDADGNTIVGSSNYSSAIKLTIYDPANTGTLSLSANSIASPAGTANLVYNGETLVTAQVQAQAGNAYAAANVNPTPTVYEFSVAGEPQYITQKGVNGGIFYTDNNNTIGHLTPLGVAVNAFTIPTTNADPQGIIYGEDGNLWFTEYNASKITRMTGGGVFSEYGTLFGSDAPQMLTDRGDGTVWYAGYGGNHVGYVNEFNGVAGETTLPTGGSGPWDLAEGTDGNLYVSENLNDDVAWLATLFQSPIPQTAITSGSESESIVKGPDGNMWIVQFGLNAIARLTVPGHVVTSYATASASSVPVDITVGVDGYLYYTESGIDRIGRMNTSGLPTGEYKTISINTGLKGITAASDGSIWFCESNTSKVGRLVL